MRMLGAKQMLLGDVVRFGNGKAIKPGGEGLYPVYGSNGIIGGSNEFRHENGIVIGRVGAYCGAVIYCQTKFWASDNTLVAYPALEQVDTKFLYYLLADAKLSRYAGGAAQPLVTQTVLKQVEVRVPALSVQQRIACILSAYDELIENSQRRIKILETMARALYREWFVHFRFPGHENYSRVASPLGEIPQGWRVKKLGEIISTHIGGGWGKDVPDEDHTEPAWVIRGTDIPEARYSQVGGIPHRIHTASNLRSRRLLAGDIVFEVSGGSKGQPVGRALLITPELLASLGGDVICASFCKRIQPDITGYGSELLYLSLLEGYETGEIEQYQVQSTGISNFKWTEYIANTDRVVPPDVLRSEFHRHVTPLFTQIATIGRKIQNLRRTRDLLLPRLLSGHIDLGGTEEDGLAQVVVSPAPVQVPPRPNTSIKVEVATPKTALEPENASRPIGTVERDEVLCTIRKVFGDGTERNREVALRDIAYALGYQRLGPRIREALSRDLIAALRRGIVVNAGENYRLGFRSFADCPRDALKDAFESAIGRAWIVREDAIRAFARWAGFGRVGDVIDQTARSLINGLIREGRIETDGPELIRRT